MELPDPSYHFRRHLGVAECSYALAPGWRLVAFIDGDATGQLGIRALCVVPEGDAVTLDALTKTRPGTITASLWRSVPVGAVADEFTSKHAEMLKMLAEMDAEQDSGESERKWEAREREWQAAWRQRHGPKGHPDKLYAELAVRFLGIVRSANRRPLDSLAKTLGWPRGTTERRIREARARGLLTKPSRGSVGGELTLRAVELTGYFVGKEATWQALERSEREARFGTASGSET